MNIPNKLTLLRIFLVPVFAACFYINHEYKYYIAAFVFIAAYLTDIFDGSYARKHNIVTTFGKFMDPIADKLLTGSAIIMLVSDGLLHPIAALVFIGREFIISGFRLVAAGSEEGKVLLWQAKTVTQCIAIVLLLLKNPIFGRIGIRMDTIMVMISLVFTVWSAYDYIYKNRKLIKYD